MDRPDATLSLNSFEMLHHGKTVMGSFFGGLKPKSHIPILLQSFMDKVINEKVRPCLVGRKFSVFCIQTF